MSKLSIKPHYCHGINGVKVGFVFSYPGSKNINEGKPLNGMASANLNYLLCKLNKSDSNLFPYCNWNSYRITNSYSQTIYNKGKSLYDLEIISDERNLLRLKEEINGMETLICFGEKAYFAVKKVVEKFNLDLQIIKVANLSNSNISRSLQSINKKNNARIRTNYKVLGVYQDILNALNNKG